MNMELLKRELILLKTKLNTLMQIGNDCKNLINYSEGFVKRDLSLIRLNFEVKLRKLVEKHTNELKAIAKEEREVIDWEVKCIQDETKRLEKSADEFQTTGDKQKARIFQEEVQFLQKVIGKAAEKFKRKQLKFQVHDDVRQYFDKLQTIGRIDIELVGEVGAESNVKNAQKDKHRDTELKETQYLDKSKTNHNYSSFEQLMVHPRLKNGEVSGDNKDNAVVSTKNKLAAKEIDPFMYCNKEEKTGRDISGITVATNTVSSIPPTNIRKPNSLATPTEDDWVRYRESEMRKTKIKSETEKGNQSKIATNLANEHVVDKSSRASVLQDICDKLDIETKYIHKFSRDMTVSDHKIKADKGSIIDDQNTSHSVSHSRDTCIKVKDDNKDNDFEANNSPRGIIKNWSRGKSSLRRSKSDSSKYSTYGFKPERRVKPHYHVTFADISDQSVEEIQYEDRPNSGMVPVVEKPTNEDLIDLNATYENKDKTPLSCDSEKQAGVDKVSEQFPNTTFPRKSKLSASTENFNTALQMTIINSSNPLISEPQVSDTKHLQKPEINSDDFLVLNRQEPEARDSCNFGSTLKESQIDNCEISPRTYFQDSAPSINDDSVLDSIDLARPKSSQTNGFRVSNARLAAYVRRRLHVNADDYPTTISSYSRRTPLSSQNDSAINWNKKDSDLSRKDPLHIHIQCSTDAPGLTGQGISPSQPKSNRQRLPSSEEMLFDL